MDDWMFWSSGYIVLKFMHWRRRRRLRWLKHNPIWNKEPLLFWRASPQTPTRTITRTTRWVATWGQFWSTKTQIERVATCQDYYRCIFTNSLVYCFAQHQHLSISQQLRTDWLPIHWRFSLLCCASTWCLHKYYFSDDRREQQWRCHVPNGRIGL